MGNARPDRVAAKTEGMALALVAAALWGLAPVATKAALEGYSPEALAVIRLGVAGSLFRLLAGPGAPWLPRERWSLVAGLALGVDFLLYNYGLRHTTAAVAGLVVNIEVISTIALAHWLLGERLTPRRLCGAAVAVAGVIAVALDGTSLEGLMARGRLFGNGCVMLAAMTWSVYAVCQRRATARTGGGRFEILAPIFSVATLTMLPGLLAPAARVNPAGVLPTTMLAALTLLCTVGVYLL
jgi:drug/metabolite transporter (DMT)-like permease